MVFIEVISILLFNLLNMTDQNFNDLNEEFLLGILLFLASASEDNILLIEEIAVRVFLGLAKSTNSNKYRLFTLRSSGVCLIDFIFEKVYIPYLEEITGKDVTINKFEIRDFLGFQNWLKDKFGGFDFNIKCNTFRHTYKTLFQFPRLQELAQRGIVRHPHIQYFLKINPLLEKLNYVPKLKTELDYLSDICNVEKKLRYDDLKELVYTDVAKLRHLMHWKRIVPHLPNLNGSITITTKTLDDLLGIY